MPKISVNDSCSIQRRLRAPACARQLAARVFLAILSSQISVRPTLGSELDNGINATTTTGWPIPSTPHNNDICSRPFGLYIALESRSPEVPFAFSSAFGIPASPPPPTSPASLPLPHPFHPYNFLTPPPALDTPRRPTLLRGGQALSFPPLKKVQFSPCPNRSSIPDHPPQKKSQSR